MSYDNRKRERERVIPINLNKYINSLSIESTNTNDIFTYINKNRVSKYYSIEAMRLDIEKDIKMLDKINVYSLEENVFSKIGRFLKGLLDKFINFCKMIINKIKGLFNKAKNKVMEKTMCGKFDEIAGGDDTFYRMPISEKTLATTYTDPCYIKNIEYRQEFSNTIKEFISKCEMYYFSGLEGEFKRVYRESNKDVEKLGKDLETVKKIETIYESFVPEPKTYDLKHYFITPYVAKFPDDDITYRVLLMEMSHSFKQLQYIRSMNRPFNETTGGYRHHHEAAKEYSKLKEYWINHFKTSNEAFEKMKNETITNIRKEIKESQDYLNQILERINKDQTDKDLQQRQINKFKEYLSLVTKLETGLTTMILYCDNLKDSSFNNQLKLIDHILSIKKELSK